MSCKIRCETYEKCTYFKIVGEAGNHLDSIARYVRAKATDRRGIVMDIRALTIRPRADEVFIHVLKYPPGASRKIALIRLNKNHSVCSLYEQLARTRGYRACCFDDLESANRWVVNDDGPLQVRCNRWSFLAHGLTILRHSLNPLRLRHATTR